MDHSCIDLNAYSEYLGNVPRRGLLRRVAGAGLAVTGIAGSLRHAPATAAQEATPPSAPFATPAPADAHAFRVGQRNLWVFDDGDYTIPGAFLAINAPPGELAEALAQVGQSLEAYTTTINNLLIDTGDQLVLIDTGFGSNTPTTGQLHPALQAEGIAPEDIDIVLLTHLHADHYGGMVNAVGKPTFPNARYLINRTEYEFWWAEPSLAELPIPDDFKQGFREGAKGVLTALQGTVEQIEPGDEIAPGVTALAAPGHTPGHLAVEVASDGERLLHIVDAALDPVGHLHHPDWFAAPDNWPAHAILTRRALFDRAAQEDLLVLTYHFPFPGLGHVRQDGESWLWEPVT
jgi:glyoxylase-like metal-dependent hydrolase (beta-lactamase superfamily II)